MELPAGDIGSAAAAAATDTMSTPAAARLLAVGPLVGRSGGGGMLSAQPGIEMPSAAGRAAEQARGRY